MKESQSFGILCAFFFGFELFMDIYEISWNTFLHQEESEKKERRNSRRGEVRLKSREMSVQPFNGRHVKMWLLTQIKWRNL